MNTNDFGQTRLNVCGCYECRFNNDGDCLFKIIDVAESGRCAMYEKPSQQQLANPKTLSDPLKPSSL